MYIYIYNIYTNIYIYVYKTVTNKNKLFSKKQFIDPMCKQNKGYPIHNSELSLYSNCTFDQPSFLFTHEVQNTSSINIFFQLYINTVHFIYIYIYICIYKKTY